MKIWAELPPYPKELKSHSPFIRARRRHVPLLAGISLQSPLEAGNAFTESLRGWESLFKVLSRAIDLMPRRTFLD